MAAIREDQRGNKPQDMNPEESGEFEGEEGEFEFLGDTEELVDEQPSYLEAIDNALARAEYDYDNSLSRSTADLDRKMTDPASLHLLGSVLAYSEPFPTRD